MGSAASGLLSAMSPEEQASPNDFETIKAILAPFREIFNMIIENDEMLRISRIVCNEFSQSMPFSTDVPVHVVYREAPHGSNPELVKGKDSFPPGTSPEMQRAVLKLNTCDGSVVSFLPYVTNALEDIDARAEWVLVHAKPRFFIHYNGERFREPAHSVFCITTSDGSQFIADLTIEQFGYAEECWFTTKSYYLENFTKDGVWHPITEGGRTEIESFASEGSFLSRLIIAANFLISTLDWNTYKALPSQDRMVWIRNQLREMIGEGIFGV